MAQIKRRTFVQATVAAAAVGAFGVPAIARAGKPKARVVVIGGGYGGAIVAKYLLKEEPDLRVTLIEKDSRFVSCPLSNEVLSGERDIRSLTFDYRGLSRRGVNIMQDEIVEIDATAKFVRGASGNKYNYDKLVVSPGVDFKWDAIPGYDEAASEKLPHAWKAGPQTLLLRRQLQAMKDGGTFCIVAPPNPYRCPPGPYERAAQVALYFKHHKPKSKILILDPKDKFSKQGLFQQGWKQEYGDMIEWVSGAAGGIIEEIDPKTRTMTGAVEEFNADVVNVIPPQKAGKIAEVSGLADEKGWCPVDPKTFESTVHKDVYVIGDACIAGAMPKSGYAANSQGKVCAAAIAAVVNGKAVPEPSYVNTCYSIIGPKYGISVAAVYQLKDGKIVGVEGAGGLSPMDASPRVRALEVQYAIGWYKNITSDMFT